MSEKYIVLIVLGLIALVLIVKLIKQSSFKLKIGNGELGGVKKWCKDNRKKILIGGFSYLALLVTFAILLPDKWAMYWGHQDFFWITQVYIAIMIATIWLDIWSVKWFLRIAFTVILAVYGIGKIPEGPPKGTGTEVVMQQTTITRSIVAYPGKWTAVHVDKHYNGRWFKDGSREFENLKRLVKVRFNGKSVESESMTPEGNIIEVNYKSGETIRLIEFQSLGTEPVYIIVEFIKKRVIA